MQQQDNDVDRNDADQDNDQNAGSSNNEPSPPEEKPLLAPQDSQLRCARLSRGRIYRQNSVRDMNAVVLLRYGTLNPTESELTRPMRTVMWIAQRIGIPWSTIDGILRRFLSNGCRAVSHRKNCGRRADPIEPATLAFVRSRAELERQVHMTLQQRCARIREATGTDLSIWQLRSVYKRLGIRFVRPQSAYQSEFRKDQQLLLQERLDFAQRLDLIIRERGPLIYVDQTTFNTWLHTSRSWMRPD